MKRVTAEWVGKAEADLDFAHRAYRTRKKPNYDLACFLAQQCIEKYLKARLQEAGVAFARTHDLEALLNQLRPLEPGWLMLMPLLKPISIYAVAFRYPGKFCVEGRSSRRAQVRRTTPGNGADCV